MRKFRYRPQALVALAIMAAAAIWLFSASYPELEQIQPASEDAAATLNADHEFVQTFTATSDSISRVVLILDKMNPKSQGTMRFQLMEYKGTDPEGSPVFGDFLRDVSLDTQSFDYRGGQRFEFDSQPLTEGAMYAIRLTGDNRPDESVWVLGTATNDFKGIVYKGGVLYDNGAPTRGELYFEIYQNTSISGLLAKIVPFRPEPLSSAAFFEALFVIGAGSFGWLLWEVGAGTGAGKREE